MPYLFPVLIAKGICQEYHALKPVLSDIDVTVQPGQIHALVGQSGAGKTALAEILGGAARPTAGTLHVQGQLVAPKTRQEAAGMAIGYIPQEWERDSRPSVAEALQIEPVPRKFGLIDNRALCELARGQLSLYGLNNVDPNDRIGELPFGTQKLIQLAAALAKPACLFVLDDPTAGLTDAETEVVFQRLSQVLAAEAGILYLTGRAEEALRVGEQISVLRDGKLIATHMPDGLLVTQIVGEMNGRDPSQEPVRPTRPSWPEVALRAEGISIENCVCGLSLKVRRGEVLGLLGLQGAGVSEAVRAIGGAEPRNDGEIFLNASASASRIKSPADATAQRLGIILDPRGRVADGNGASGAAPGGLQLRMNVENPQRTPVMNALRAGCSVLLFDNPTRGLNVANRLEVYQAIQDFADRGGSVIAGSTDVDELMTICDRIAVMVNGRIIRTVDRPSFSAEKLWAMLKMGR